MSNLNPKLFDSDVELEATRSGFGKGLLKAGQINSRVVALCADLTESTQMHLFRDEFPERFFQVGVAEQNLVTVATGLAATGKIPFVSSYAAFSPGRNWEQIRTTICLNERKVIIVGSHAGVSVGPDGGTHQMLEDIALMRVLPNMTVVVPCDTIEAEKATLALPEWTEAVYLRLAREKSPIVTTANSPFRLGQAEVLREGKDITIVACGLMVYEALVAAESLTKAKISAEVINSHTIKPLDRATILKSARKTGRVITAEEAQAAGGLGGAVAELLAEELPTPLKRIGVLDHFGESGKPNELFKHFNLTAKDIAAAAKALIK